MRPLRFAVEVDTDANMKPLFTSSELMNERKNKKDLKVGIILPDGRREFKYITRKRLNNISSIELVITENEFPLY